MRNPFRRISKRKATELSYVRRFTPHTILVILLVVVLLALFAVPAVFVNSVVGYLPVLTYLFALGLSALYLLFMKRGLSFEVTGFQEECIRGNLLAFKLDVGNASMLPVMRLGVRFYVSDLFGEEGVSTVRYATMPPRSTKTFDFGLKFDHLGSFRVGITEIDIYDPLGLFHLAQWRDELKDVRVMPHLVDIDSLELSQKSETESKRAVTSVLNEGMDYNTVREYVWGDPIKSIHWKLSARSSTYLTRLYESITNPGITIVFDFDAPSAYDAVQLMNVNDAIIETGLSVEQFAKSNGMDTELLFTDGGAGRRIAGPLNREGIVAIMQEFPTIAAGDGMRALELMRNESKSTRVQNNLVLCTSTVSNELVASLIAMPSTKCTPVLFVIAPPAADDEMRKEMNAKLRRLGAAGIFYAVISSATDIGVGGE